MEVSEDAVIVHLYPPRSCFNCKNLEELEMDDEDPAAGIASFCVLFLEWIDSEAHAAKDCPVYDPVAGPSSQGGPLRGTA